MACKICASVALVPVSVLVVGSISQKSHSPEFIPRLLAYGLLLRRGCRARRRRLAPVRFDLQPAALDHLVGGSVRVGELGELRSELLGRICSERFAKTLAVIYDRLGVFGIENGTQFGNRRRRRRRIFLFFLSSRVLSLEIIFSARTRA